MKEYRARINEAELGWILAGLRKAGYHEARGSARKVYHRLLWLGEGYHIRERVYEKPEPEIKQQSTPIVFEKREG